MNTDTYGTKLLPSTKYRQMFLVMYHTIRRVVGPAVRIEHVGGTSLKKPSGKGDIDIYVEYTSSAERRRIENRLQTLFGKPAKRTKGRTRFSDFFRGVEVELQLSDTLAIDTAAALRNYLNDYPGEAKKYARQVARMRKSYLARMYKLKSSYAKKAVKEMKGSVG
ncbi:MAG: GrpB family protein [Candidatus Kerfeldbacteria bacterium]|nr:GrpB family protein [Candidatus Kerfeldbacteria bacterium]